MKKHIFFTIFTFIILITFLSVENRIEKEFKEVFSGYLAQLQPKR